MRFDSNFISITGDVIEKKEGAYLLHVIRKDGNEDLIWAWNLPELLELGTRINVVGELAFKVLWDGSKKKLLGVKATTFFVLDEKEFVEDFTMITGAIMRIGKSRRTSISNQKYLELGIRLKDGIVIPVIVWNDMVRLVEYKYKLGMKVHILGTLNRREYVKMVNGHGLKKATTEVNVFKIEIV